MTGPFRMMRLNVVGWSALVGAGLVVGVPGIVAGRNPALSLAGGVAAAFVVVWADDHRRWRRSWTSLGIPISDDEGEARAEEMRSQGLDVYFEPQIVDGDSGEIRRSGMFRCRAPHAPRVARALGIPDVHRMHRRRP